METFTKANASGTIKDKKRTAVSNQVANSKNPLKLFSHGVVLHGHEERVEDDAHGDGQVQEGVHHHDVHLLLQPQPAGAAAPHQVPVGEHVPARVALLMGLLQLCGGAEESLTSTRTRHDNKD